MCLWSACGYVLSKISIDGFCTLFHSNGVKQKSMKVLRRNGKKKPVATPTNIWEKVLRCSNHGIHGLINSGPGVHFPNNDVTH